MSVELEKIVIAQSEQIANLTGMFAHFMQQKMSNDPTNMVYCGSQTQQFGEVNFDNSRFGIGNQETMNSAENSNFSQEELEIMKQIKNVVERKDGRLMWREQIDNFRHTLTQRRKELRVDFYKRVKSFQRNNFKRIFERPLVFTTRNSSPTLIDLCEEYVNRYKTGKIASDDSYRRVVKNQLQALDRPITSYKKNDIEDFYNSISGAKRYCHLLLKQVFADALDTDIITKNIMANIKNPESKGEKKMPFTPEQQKILLDNTSASIAKEIKFFLLTGVRLAEAFTCKIDFARCVVRVHGTKTENAQRSIEISKKIYAEELKSTWGEMFKVTPKYLSKAFSEHLEKLGMKNKSLSLHSLRHTFATNLYYLGVPDQEKANAPRS